MLNIKVSCIIIFRRLVVSYELLGRACGFFLRLTQEECHHELGSRTRTFKTYISNSCFKVSTIMYIYVCILRLIIHIFCPLDICYKKYHVNVLCNSKGSCSCPSWWIHCVSARTGNSDVGRIRRCEEHVLQLWCTPVWLAYTFARISWYSKGQCKTKLPPLFLQISSRETHKMDCRHRSKLS